MIASSYEIMLLPYNFLVLLVAILDFASLTKKLSEEKCNERLFLVLTHGPNEIYVCITSNNFF